MYDIKLSECLCWHIDNARGLIESENEWVNAWCVSSVMRGENVKLFGCTNEVLRGMIETLENEFESNAEWTRKLFYPRYIIDILLYFIHMHYVLPSYLHQFIYNKHIFIKNRTKYASDVIDIYEPVCNLYKGVLVVLILIENQCSMDRISYEEHRESRNVANDRTVRRKFISTLASCVQQPVW